MSSEEEESIEEPVQENKRGRPRGQQDATKDFDDLLRRYPMISSELLNYG